ncbi:MAG: radical SAM protein [bacterium]|nr:radical SAM protein [bacterium]
MTYLNATTAYCSECRQVEQARIVADDNGVYMERMCVARGTRRVRIAADAQWYIERMKQLPRISAVAEPRESKQGCPFDCGPCTWHSNGLRLPVFSITNDCNLDCPKCFTYNRPDKKYFKSVEETRQIIRHITAQSDGLQLINLTGGEPTLHPDLFEIIEACRHPKIQRITMNTNGLRLAQDFSFAQKIKETGIQLVLSLDTLQAETSRLIHGKDITNEKEKALETLERLDIPTTILTVCIDGVNHTETAGIVDTYIRKNFVRSVTIQNMTYTGLNGSAFEPRKHITMDEVEALVCAGKDFKREDFFPLGSYHPMCYSAAYYIFYDRLCFPLARVLGSEALRALTEDSYLPDSGGDFSAPFMDGLNRLWAEGEDPETIAALKKLIRRLYPPGNKITQEQRGELLEKHIKPIYIHPHMDADNFDLDRVSRCGDLVPDENGSMVPACSYNLLYRQKDQRFWGGHAPKGKGATPPRVRGLRPRVNPVRKEGKMDKVYSHTIALCPQCRQKARARIISRENAVYLEKFCPTHGLSSVLISSDIQWYEASMAYVKPGQAPLKRNVSTFKGCPESCGSCPQHQQHTCLPVIEIISHCQMACPVCLKQHERHVPPAGLPAGQRAAPLGTPMCPPGAVDGERLPGTDAGCDALSFELTVDEFSGIIDNLIACEGKVDVINLSGGEPTLHPHFETLLDIALEKGVTQISVSTNGLTLLTNPELRATFKRTQTIAAIQFDGFNPETYTFLRGQDLSKQKLELIKLMEKENIPYSLVATIAKNINEKEVPAIVDFFFKSRALTLMFQPTTFTGHAANLEHSRYRLTIPCIIKELEKSSHINKGDFNPLPCSHYSCFALAYYLTVGNQEHVSVKSFLGEEDLLTLCANKTLPGLDGAGFTTIRNRLFELWSAADSAGLNEKILTRIKGILRSMQCGTLSNRQKILIGAEHMKAIFIHHFMDLHTMDLGRLVKCCNPYPRPGDKLVPMCAANAPPAARGGAPGPHQGEAPLGTPPAPTVQ